MVRIALTVSLLLVGSPASAAGGYGHVDFANSGAPSAQADFLDGLALLHDFEYPAAAAAFRRAEAADPGFAMAYWGEAMTFNHPIWMQQDLEAARAALSNLAPTPAERRAQAKTDREKGYLDAVERHTWTSSRSASTGAAPRWQPFQPCWTSGRSANPPPTSSCMAWSKPDKHITRFVLDTAANEGQHLNCLSVESPTWAAPTSRS